MLSRAVQDLYRCPPEFAQFELNGEISSEESFFDFGPHAVGYGRLCGEQRSTDSRRLDVRSHARDDHGSVRLPFYPDEVIDNLRLERYRDRSGKGWPDALRRLYYAIRPATTLAIRRSIQRFHAWNWEDISFPSWPVDTSVEAICRELLLLALRSRHVDRVPFIWFWPRGANGCATMTHDVETEEGRNACGRLMDVDDSFGIKASFQLVPEGRYVVSWSFLDEIRQRRFEIGVQDLNHDGHLYDDHSRFLSRAERINRYRHEFGADGFRAGALYRRPDWYCALGFQYDMSIPNVAHLDPQRGGCCTVMPYFIGKILELPVTTIQDYSLFHLLGDYSIHLWKVQLERIRKNNGLAMFIIHPDYVQEDRAMSVYRALLAYLVELRAREQWWVALPREVDAWWRARAEMSLVRDGSGWRIEGDRADEAVLAFACEREGQLHYELSPAKTRASFGATVV